MAQNSPGLRSNRTGLRNEVIDEEDPDELHDGENGEHGTHGAQSRFSKKTGKKSIISGAGLRSN